MALVQKLVDVDVLAALHHAPAGHSEPATTATTATATAAAVNGAVTGGAVVRHESDEATPHSVGNRSRGTSGEDAVVGPSSPHSTGSRNLLEELAAREKTIAQQEELALDAQFDASVQFVEYELRRAVGYESITSFNTEDAVALNTRLGLGDTGARHVATKRHEHGRFATTSVRDGVPSDASAIAVESPQQHSNAFTDLGEGIDEEDDPLSQAARMSESLLQLDTLRHRLAVLPSTQWVIAHADFDGRRLEAVSQRHRQVTEALTTAGKSPLGRHSRASTAAGSRQQARDREAQAMAQRHQARTWRRVLGGGGREMDGDEGGRQGAASQGTDLRAHAKRKGAPWFVTILHTGVNGVVPSEAVVVESEVMKSQTQQMKEFSRGMRKYMRQRLAESRHHDALELRRLSRRLEVLDQKELHAALDLDCLASVADPKERAKLIQAHNTTRLMNDAKQLEQLAAERRQVLVSVVDAIAALHADSSTGFAEGPELLFALGTLFQRACHSIDVEHRQQLRKALRKAGAPTSRQVKTDPLSPMHRKLRLCSDALSQWMRLSHDDYVVYNCQPPSSDPRWGVACANGSPQVLWRAEVNRSHLKSVDDTLRLVSQGRTPKSWPAAIAQLLSTVLPDKHASVNLRVRVLMHPRRGWRLVCQRRDELGFAHTDPCALSLADSMGTTPAKEPVLDLLQQVRERICSYTKLYYEVHVPTMSDGTHPEWVIGFTRMEGDSPTSHVPGRTPFSFGVCSDGTVMFNAQRVEYCHPLSKERVVGLVLDLGAGSISVVTPRDGTLHPAFGRGSRVKSKAQRREESAALLSLPLVPCVALLGKRSGISPAHNERLAPHFHMSDNLPRMAVNFGAFTFMAKPPDAVACDAFLSFPPQSDHPASNQRVHHTPRQRPAMTTQQRAALMMDLEQSAWTWGGSWSRFPSHVMGGGDQSLALRVLQRSVRQWLARRWRVKEHRRREAAAFIVQRFFLDLLPKFERLRQQSARIIQRVFRGHRARIVCRFALRYEVSVHDIQKAASKLQRLARRIIVNRMIREVQSAIDNEVKFVEGLVSSIQCAWRRHRQRKHHYRIALLHRSARTIQSVFRGHLARREASDLRSASRLRHRRRRRRSSISSQVQSRGDTRSGRRSSASGRSSRRRRRPSNASQTAAGSRARRRSITSASSQLHRVPKSPL